MTRRRARSSSSSTPSLSTAGGTRRRDAPLRREPAGDGTAATVGPALNHAANQVALDVAQWIGG